MLVMASEGQAIVEEESVVARREGCCSAYHRAVELIGKRWTGAIVFVLLDGPLRFSEVKVLVPDLSDRLLSERMKELEAEGIVERRVIDDMPVRVEYGLATLQRTARDAGLGLDEIALAREFDSHDEREAVLLRFVKALLESDGAPPRHKHEEAREAGWEDEQILETVAHVALATFSNLVTRAGDVPLDGSSEESRLSIAA